MKRFRISLLVLPYLFFFTSLIDKNFYLEALVILLFFIALDALRLFRNEKIICLIMTGVIVFFYSIYLYDEMAIELFMRFRFFLIIFTLLSLMLSYKIVYNKLFLPLNVFLLFYSLSFIITKQVIDYKYNDAGLLNEFKYISPIKGSTKSEKPIIFIIFDEDSSNDDVGNYLTDTAYSQFDTQLRKNGFVINNNFKSSSKSTGFSLPSIFNFNMHNYSSVIQNDEKKQNGFRLFNFNSVFRDNLLVDSLKSKNIKPYSFGLIPFTKGEFVNFNHLWKDNTLFKSVKALDENEFISYFSSKTLFVFLDRFIKNESEVIKIDNFREEVYNSLNNTNFKNNSFYYFHFMAPHAPFSWKEEYPLIDIPRKDGLVYLNNHLNYKLFFHKKILPLLVSKKMKNCRIIISGDHGFREYRSHFDPLKTNLYLYGFDSLNIESIKTVQDLGYLINESF